MKIFGFAGWSGSGKTTLIEQLIPLLTRDGLTVSLVKHAHHDFDVDQPGKDSWRHRKAGCAEVLVSSARRWALMHELGEEPEMTLSESLARLSPCDLVLIEGYKRAPIPKLEIHRSEIGKPPLFPGDPHIVGFATDAPERFADARLPVLDLSNAQAIRSFVIAHCSSVEIDKTAGNL
jgi:molybdopterin-guanine dinucleotide biosynthesis protein B